MVLVLVLVEACLPVDVVEGLVVGDVAGLLMFDVDDFLVEVADGLVEVDFVELVGGFLVVELEKEELLVDELEVGQAVMIVRVEEAPVSTAVVVMIGSAENRSESFVPSLRARVKCFLHFNNVPVGSYVVIVNVDAGTVAEKSVMVTVFPCVGVAKRNSKIRAPVGFPPVS